MNDDRSEIEKKMDVVVNAEDVSTPEGLQNAFDRAAVHNESRLAVDEECTKKRPWHIHEVLTGFMTGFMNADPWYTGYQLPPNFELVVNKIAKAIREDPPGQLLGNEVFEGLSLLDLRDWLRKTAMAIPEFVAWNDTEGPDVKFTSRYTPTQTKRDFIDLDAAIHNGMIVLRNWARDHDRFDEAFEKEYGRKPFAEEQHDPEEGYEDEHAEDFLLKDGDTCVDCNEPAEYRCARCSEPSCNDCGNGSSLCSYCNHMCNKDD